MRQQMPDVDNDLEYGWTELAEEEYKQWCAWQEAKEQALTDDLLDAQRENYLK